MSDQLELATRIELLEREVAILKQHFQLAEQEDDWFERTAGRLKDFPEWEEVCRLGAEMRKADRLNHAS